MFNFINPLNGVYGSLIKFGLVLALLGSLYGAHLYKVHKAVQAAETKVELRLKDEMLAQKEVLLLKKRASEKELEKDFAKRQGVNDEKIKQLNTTVSSLLNSLQSRPSRPISTGNNDTSTRAETLTKGATGAELYKPDAEFLVGEATRAETIRLGLIQCYADYDSLKNTVETFNQVK